MNTNSTGARSGRLQLYFARWYRRTSATNRLMLGLAVLVAVSVIIRAPFFRLQIVPDEASYAYVARVWTDNYLLYREIPFNKPPAIFLAYKVILAAIGTDGFAIRLGIGLYNAVAAVALFFTTQAVFSRRAAWISTLAYTVASMAPHVEGFTANGEQFMALPLILAAYWTWKERWGLVGLAAGMAFLFKPNGLAAVVVAGVWWLVVRASWRDALRAMIGFAVGPLAVGAYGYAIGWHSFWVNFVQQTLLTNSFLNRTPTMQFANFIAEGFRTAPAWMFVGVPAVGALLVMRGRPRWFGLLWLVSAGMGIWINGRTWLHYFYQAVAPLAFLSGPGLLALPHMKRRWFWQGMIVLAGVMFIVWELPLWFASPTAASWKLYDSRDLEIAPEVAAYVEAHTSEQATIYVAFTHADIYYLSHRRAQPAQMFWYEVNRSARIFDWVEEAIRRRKPDMIVWAQAPPEQRATFEEFDQLIRQGYVEVQRFGSGDPRTDGMIVFQRKAE